MLATIHNDHINMSRLLHLLRNRIDSLKKDEKIDFRLIKTIVTYLRTYSDKYHHPMEDLIFDYYVSHCVVPDTVGTRLSEEHKMLKKVTIDLDDLLNMILLDAIVPQEQCIEKLEQFVGLQKGHLAYEEQQLLPLIEKSLTEDDWAEIKQQWLSHHEYTDPLFGNDVPEQYRTLADAIKQL